MHPLYALPAVLFLAVSGHLLFSAVDHPLKPIPEGVDPVYLLLPAFLLGFCGLMFSSFVFGATWQTVESVVHDVITNMFAII